VWCGVVREVGRTSEQTSAVPADRHNENYDLQIGREKDEPKNLSRELILALALVGCKAALVLRFNRQAS
jgi:hypothetical protein